MGVFSAVTRWRTLLELLLLILQPVAPGQILTVAALQIRLTHVLHMSQMREVSVVSFANDELSPNADYS